MLGAIKYQLANLTNFDGRDARQTFWYYILFLVVIQFVVGMIASIPMYVSMVSGVFDAISDGADEQAAMTRMIDNMTSQISTQMVVSIVIGAVISLMMIAAFVRRLHDAGYAGWIVAIPLATQAFSIAHTFSLMGRIEEIMRETMTASMEDPTGAGANPFAMQADMGALSLVGWIGYIVVIVFGVFRSQEGANRYGEEPVRF